MAGIIKCPTWLRDVGLLEWICHFRPKLSYNRRHTFFFFLPTNIVRNKLVRRAPASLKSSGIAFLHRPDLTETEMKWESLDPKCQGAIPVPKRRHYCSTSIKRIKWNVTNIKPTNSTSQMKMEILHERYKIQSSVKKN